MFSNSCLWTVDYFGSLYKFDIDRLEYICTSRCDPNSRKDSFKKISSLKTCVWGIGGDQNVYMMVSETDQPITAQEHCYENQRWYPRYGWSQKSVIIYCVISTMFLYI